jgi:hypothetical protein
MLLKRLVALELLDKSDPLVRNFFGHVWAVKDVRVFPDFVDCVSG